MEGKGSTSPLRISLSVTEVACHVRNLITNLHPPKTAGLD